MKNFEQIAETLKGMETKTVAVACAACPSVLKATVKAKEQKIANPIYVGEKAKIEALAKENNLDISGIEIIDEADGAEACAKAVALITNGKAQFLMKGLIDTGVILKAALNRDAQLRTGKKLSHIMAMEINGRMYLVTDGGMNIAPTLEDKVDILRNSVEFAHKLGSETPLVAAVSAVEKVNPKMQSSVDARALEDMNKSGEITGCIVGGPFALDNAVSEAAAKAKGMDHPVAGKAEIILVPAIEVANVLYKTLMFMGPSQDGIKSAGAVVGAKCPIVVTSRADSSESKLNAIAMCAIAA